MSSVRQRWRRTLASSLHVCGSMQASTRFVLPNKRLKLTGGDRFRGTGVLCPWRGTDCVHHSCAGELVARSLSAIR